jgi:CheY-like chemotaxis protein
MIGSIMTIGFDAHFLYLLRRYIVMSSYRHIIANNHEDALELAKLTHPLLIIIEISQQNSMAWNTLHSLKKDQKLCRIPIVVCSWQDEEERSLQEGADSYMNMPILYDNFKSVLVSTGLCA